MPKRQPLNERATFSSAVAPLVALVLVLLVLVCGAEAQIPFPDGFTPPPAAKPTTTAPDNGEPPIATRQSEFSIPFSIPQNASSAGSPEVFLYLSTDRGATWRQYAAKRQAEGYFDFRAGGDGEYWFVSRTAAGGAPKPPASGAKPELKVLVDTRSPQMEFSAVVGSSGEVAATWRADDPTIQPRSFKIEYRPLTGDGAQAWQPVTVEPNNTSTQAGAFTGRTSWRPATSAKVIYVRAEIVDQAGNPAVATRQVYLPRVASRRDPDNPATAPPTDLAARPAPSLGAIPWTDGAVKQQPSLPVNIARLPATDATASQAPANGPQSSAASSASRYPQAAPNAELPANADAGRYSPFQAVRSPADRTLADSQYQPVRGTVHPPVSDRLIDRPAVDQTAPPTATSGSAYGPPPGEYVQQTSSMAFQLDYDVDAIGPQGVAEVELWGTSDGGRTWTRWATDPDRTSPFDVNVEREGQYGFRIVVVGNNGLAGQAPRTGDPADVWVGVDVTKPTGELTSAVYGDGERAGILDVHWTADDANLGERPVTLQYANQPGGPWTTIAAGLENAGSYAWRIDPRVPQQVYLRMEVRDEAGNLHAHELRDPISTAGLIPTARIRNVRPAR